MTEPPIHVIRVLESAAGWGLLMALFSGAVLGAAAASILFGQLTCGG